MIEERGVTCMYCGGEAQIYEEKAYHRYIPDHGPFRIFRCKSCGSLLTDPVPSEKTLADMYQAFNKGMAEKPRELRTNYPLKSWFLQCMKHMMQGTGLQMKPDFSWIELGAGEGEMAELMVQHFPGHQGTAVDFVVAPESLHEGPVKWICADMAGGLPEELEQADLVFAITVLEHMADPVQFIKSALRLLKPGGVFYFNCPRADSGAFKILGRKWPYYIPGEHLTIPTIGGIEKLMDRECRSLFSSDCEIRVNPVIMPYPFGFYAGYFLPFLEKVFPFSFDVYFPTGILECRVRRPN
jgi:SAM-dependent methyltransferase